MQKSKKLTIFLIIIVTLFFLFCQNVLSKLSEWYTYILRPICFIGIAGIINVLISSQLTMRKSRKDIVQYVVITNLIYIIIYLVSGIFPGFGNNPYDTSLKGIIINIFSNMPVIISLELMRYKLVNNVYKRDRKLIFILVVFSFSIWDLNFRRFFGTAFAPYTIFTFVFYSLIPIVIENVLFTYIAGNGDYIPNIVYRGLYNLFLWTFPILPKLPWIFEAILSTILPFFLLLYIRYLVSKKNKDFIYMNIEEENPRGLLPFTVLLVFAIWFTLGAFPIKPIGVATASMYPNINVGDMVIIKQVKPDKLAEGDIIAYKYNDTTVVHRIKYINKKENQNYEFITKGDNNYFEDTKPVKEDQIVGVVIYKIKHVAYPTLWLHSLYTSREDVGVETGKDID